MTDLDVKDVSAQELRDRKFGPCLATEEREFKWDTRYNPVATDGGEQR